jgi:hypothetical protein
MVPNKVDMESISKATTKFMAVPKTFLFFRPVMAMVKKVRLRRAKVSAIMIRGFDGNIFFSSNSRQNVVLPLSLFFQPL